ncbi:MAG: PIG-L family deacetylase [Anaerolineae bacterium]
MSKSYTEPPIPQTALIIMAHPDDVEFVMGGTVIKWRQAGCRVRYVLVTSGDAGSHEPDMTRETLAQLREAEQWAAARHIGAEEVIFLGYHDGEVEPTLTLRRELMRQIRRFKPQVVVTFDPTQLYVNGQYINHPDHRAVGQAVLDAVAPAAAMRLNFPELLAEGLEPHRVREVYVASPANPDTWIDVTTTFDLKLETLLLHKTQFPGDWDPAELLRPWAAEAGAKIGVPYAEAFKRIILEREATDSA